VIEIPSNTTTTSKGSKTATASAGGSGGKNSKSTIVRMLSKSSGNSTKSSANSSKGSANSRSSKGSSGATFESAPDDTPCDDEDDTTNPDVCFGGFCAGRCAGVTCEAVDPQCQVDGSGVCDSTTGACVFTNEPDDTTGCDDGVDTTDPDVCFDGVCAGRCAGVTCNPDLPCQTEAVCDSLNGGCVFTNADDDTQCDDGDDVATENDVCFDGVCAGRCAGVDCSPDVDACQAGGICDSETGMCSFGNAPTDAPCDDGNAMTIDDVCDDNGVCAGACTDIDCTPGQCQVDGSGVCSSMSGGTCMYTNVADDTNCDDGDDATTENDVCFDGVCAGRCTGVVCTPDQPCQTGGICNSLDGTCSFITAADDIDCDDGNITTTNDVCFDGVCAGRCAGLSCIPGECQEEGTCDSSTGVCVFDDAADGTMCDDGDTTTTDDVCFGGVCAGRCAGVVCIPSQCQDQGICISTSGGCTFTNQPQNTTCDDGNGATTNDRCDGNGFCAGTYACNSEARAGGDGITVFNVELGTNGGTFTAFYQMYRVPDSMVIEYEGNVIFTTGGLVSGSATIPVTYGPGTSTQITVTMTGSNSGTVWEARIDCP